MACIVWEGPTGDGKGQLDGVVTVGRDDGSDIHLNSHWVSKRHAVLREVDGGWTMEDAGSRNGILVNGARTERVSLSDGDVVYIGPFKLSFYAGDAPVATSRQESHESDLDAMFGQLDGIVGDDREVARVTSLSSVVPLPGLQGEVGDVPREMLARRLKASYAISNATATTLEQSVLLNRVIEALFDIFDTAERGFVLLVDTERQEVKAGAVKRRDGISSDVIAVSRTAVNQVLEKREALLCLDAMQDNLLGDVQSVTALGIRSLMIAPLVAHDQLYGAIYIDTVSVDERYTPGDLELLSAAAAQVAGALANRELHREVLNVERLAAVGQTVAGLAHCIRNILQIIKGGGYIIDSGFESGDTESVVEGWSMVKRSNGFMEELLLDLLAFSKPRQPEYVATDLNQLCEEICALGRERIKGGAVSVAFVPCPGLEQLDVNPKGIRRCVLNLVANAIDACMDQGGVVSVAVKRAEAGEGAEIVVRDTGCGMSSETIEKLFDVFFSTKGANGTGLGLPITEKIIREHGGHIFVDSIPGVGTGFTIRLPTVSPRSTGH